jgi:hypothetical protein
VEYLEALVKVQRNEFMLPLFHPSPTGKGGDGGTGEQTQELISSFLSSDELFQWCDPHLEIFNSIYNRRRYRQWNDKFKIRPPPTAISET